MAETKWTPGDWENQGEGAFADMPFIRIGVGDRIICEVLPSVDVDEIDDETRANANLLLCAKDLYAALENILAVWRNEGRKPGWVKRFDAAQTTAHRVLEKARGQ